MDRRRALSIAGGALVAAGVSAFIAPARASVVPAASPRQLAFVNTHTGDTFNDAYWDQGAYVPGALAAINHVMRDHRTNETRTIDPRLLDHLYDLNRLVSASAPFQIISGYRSPATNAALHANSDGVASHSLHMVGRAIDIRVAGVDLTRLRDAALSMGNGGVGFYPGPDFIHIDTGRVRRW